MEDFKNKYEMINENMDKNISLIKNKKNNNYCILKKIFIKSQEEMNKTENEANILKNLNHKNIVKYYESFKNNNQFYIIMEYCSKKDLRNFIKEYKNNNKFIQQSIIKSIILDICSGLKEIHENNIIHRDLKPENIFKSEDNIYKIGDFGISKKLEGTKHAKTGGIGTDCYMAPELFQGQKYDNKVDIWALGCIIYELFSLEQCFGSNDSIIAVINKIISSEHGKIDLNKYSSDWQDLIDSLLQSDPKNRPNIKEIYDKVKELKDNKTTTDNMFRNCNNLKTIYLKSNKNFNMLKSQLEKDNINAQIIIK